MTREEAIYKLEQTKRYSKYLSDDEIAAVVLAIKALEQEPCEDCISRQAIEEIKEIMTDISGDSVYVARMSDIRALPFVSSHQRMGRWIPLEYDGYADGNPVWDYWECSKCGWEHSGDEESLTAFCPNCGAKMESEDKE